MAGEKQVLSELNNIVQGIDKRIDQRITARLVKESAPRLGSDSEEEGRGGFDSFGEFLQAVRFSPQDSRLQRRDLTSGTGSEGGFLVPSTFSNSVLTIGPDEAIFRPRATILPAGPSPDAEIDVPAISFGSNGVAAGVSVGWVEEGATLPTTDVDFEKVTLKPHDLGAYVIVTNKLLANTAAASVIVSELLRRAIVKTEEAAYLSGNGVGQPLGVLGHSASIEITRNTASSVAYTDLTGMLARARLGAGKSFIWVISQTVLSQLLEMEDTGGHLIWHPDVTSSPFPGRLLGIPVLIGSASPTLGNKGDVMLLALRDYLIKPGRDIIIESSPHVYFTSNKTVVKATFSVDGQPWQTEPLTLADGSTTVSSFVVLN